MSEYPNWLFELFGGKAPTEGSAEVSGNLSTIVDDVKGTSVVAAAGILATGTVNHCCWLEIGTTDFQSYGGWCSFDLRRIWRRFRSRHWCWVHKRCIVDRYLDRHHNWRDSFDSLTSESLWPLGGSATAMTIGDIAYMDVRPVNLQPYREDRWNRGWVPEFGCMIYAQKSGSGAVFEIEVVYRLKAIGLSLGAERKTFGKSDYHRESRVRFYSKRYLLLSEKSSKSKLIHRMNWTPETLNCISGFSF